MNGARKNLDIPTSSTGRTADGTRCGPRPARAMIMPTAMTPLNPNATTDALFCMGHDHGLVRTDRTAPGTRSEIHPSPA
jgi:hypothetical protein